MPPVAHPGVASEAKVESLRLGQRPAGLAADEEAAYELCQALLSGAAPDVSDATYEKAKKVITAFRR